MEENRVEKIKEIFVSSEDSNLILNLKENEIVKYIVEELDVFEQDFKNLCREFTELFEEENKWIRLSTGLCYIPELKAIIPDLATEKCYFQKSSEYFEIENLKDDSSFNEFFEKFKVKKEEKFINFILSSEEAKVFLSDQNIYKKQNNRNNKIVCCETEFVGLTYCDQCSQDNIEKYYLLDDDRSGYYGGIDDGLILTFPINRLEEHAYGTSVGDVLIYWLDNKISPLESEFKSQKSKETYDLLRILYRKNRGWFTVNDEDCLCFVQNKDDIAKFFYDEYSSKQRQFEYFRGIKEIYDRKELVADEDFFKKFKEKILALESSRVPFDNNLTDEVIEGLKSGHWDLFDYNDLVKSKCESKKEKYTVVTLPEGKYFSKRNPLYDYEDKNGKVVAIDFGTKSTVVSYRDENGYILPLQISKSGSGNSNGYDNGYDIYENPSVIQFIDLNNFIKDYKSKAGRPNTKWEDLKTSHAAFSAMNTQDHKIFMTELKSWCSKEGKEVDKQYPIEDMSGFSHIFNSYLNIDKDIIDPVEIYAYYLGLYINRLSRYNIISRYEMSFPVGFSKSIKKKIRDSFENGIKKSLPTALLNNDKFKSVIKKGLVKEELSEPAAYAITALEKYGFIDKVNDEDENNVHYAVFDFGGGTTDFDFGIYSINDGSKYDVEEWGSILTHFGEHGLPNLGGEKLVKYLAFELFKLNVKFFKKNGIEVKFTSYDGSNDNEEHGYEDYIESNSFYAMGNMHKVMEALRWLWENPKNVKSNNAKSDPKYDDIWENAEIEVNLYDEKAKSASPKLLSFKYENETISFQKLLAEKIKYAIETFLDDLLVAFKDIAKKDNLNNIEKFHIFLAGNSSKSILFNQLLSKYFGDDYGIDDFSDFALINFSREDIQKEIEDILKTVNDSKVRVLKEKLGNPDLVFKIYPPLRTAEAKQIIDYINEDNPKYKGYNINDLREPSGKTGVSYGILAAKKYQIKVVYLKPEGEEDVPFDFYVGKSVRGGRLELVLRKNDRKSMWSHMHLAKTKDDKDVYEFYYTKNGKAADNKMKLEPGNHTIGSIRTSNTENDDFIFIRPVEHNKIEWRIASDRSQLQDSDEVNQNCIITLKDN